MVPVWIRRYGSCPVWPHLVDDLANWRISRTLRCTTVTIGTDLWTTTTSRRRTIYSGSQRRSFAVSSSSSSWLSSVKRMHDGSLFYPFLRLCVVESVSAWFFALDDYVFIYDRSMVARGHDRYLRHHWEGDNHSSSSTPCTNWSANDNGRRLCSVWRWTSSRSMLARSNCHSSAPSRPSTSGRAVVVATVTLAASLSLRQTLPLLCHRQCLVTSRTGFQTWFDVDRRHVIPIVVVSSRSQQRHQQRADAVTSRHVLLHVTLWTHVTSFFSGGRETLL